MTPPPEQQRIAIAEWMGWEPYFDGEEKWKSPEGTICIDIPLYPDYPNDLNAMHEAEKKLNNEQYRKFAFILICSISDNKLIDTLWAISATAAQRSEALCRTIQPERFK